jgi:hypothetical protein
MYCASFDIGKKNFSFYVEEFAASSTSQAAKILYKRDGTPEDDSVINEFCGNGRRVLLENVDITDGCDPKAKLDPITFHNMTAVLDSHGDIWDKCSHFIIEKQMQFGRQTNPMAMKLGQHCYSYFAIRYGRFKEIIEFPAYHKTQVLGAEKIAGRKTKAGKISYKAIDKPARKKWCIARAKEILIQRGDEDGLSLILKSKKKDDLCDVICQLQAWKILEWTL